MREARVRALAGTGEPEPLLLDTHVWFWVLTANAQRLRGPVAAQVMAAMAQRVAYVSDVSPWELLLKAQRGRLALPEPARAWVDRALEAPGLRTLPLSRAVLLDALELPAGAPVDPADRFVIATARREGLTLVTADRAILAWACASGAVRVLEVA